MPPSPTDFRSVVPRTTALQAMEERQSPAPSDWTRNTITRLGRGGIGHMQ